MSSGSISAMAVRTLSVLFLVTILNVPIVLVNCEMFSAMTDLERLLYAEREVAVDLKDYIQLEEIRLEKLKAVQKDYESHSNAALENKEKYLGNPVNLYLLVKKFSMEIDDVISKFISTNETSKVVLDRLIKKQITGVFPDEEDLSGAISALLRIQDTYQIPAAKMADGDFLSKASSHRITTAKLTERDCFMFGRTAYNNNDWYHTILWMEVALDRIRFGQDESAGLSKALILDYLAFAAFKQGNIKYALQLTNELLKEDPYHQRAMNNQKYYEKVLEEEALENGGTGGEVGELGDGILNTRKLDEFRDTEEFLIYEKLCRGEDTHPAPKNLRCRYVHKRNPLLWLNPLKEETVHDKPRIDVYHNMVSDHEMAMVKKLATPRLGRATVQNAATGKLETASYRVSKSAWLKNHEHRIVNRISNRIEALTGLDMSTAEELQVANYGIGGHYEPHFDFARSVDKEPFERLGTGNRIATMLLYMSDVEAGGGTVFPRIGAKLFPKRGMGVFWYNLFKSGEGDLQTRHAACPVLAGIKWVSNKWIHERGQEFRRPCSTNQNE